MTTRGNRRIEPARHQRLERGDQRGRTHDWIGRLVGTGGVSSRSDQLDLEVIGRSVDRPLLRHHLAQLVTPVHVGADDHLRLVQCAGLQNRGGALTHLLRGL